MTLTHILVFSALALLISQLAPRRMQPWLILAASATGIYWMQPSSPIRNLDFWLPSISIGLTLMVWITTQPAIKPDFRSTLFTFILLAGVALAISLSRYLGPVCCLTASRPPEPGLILASLTACALFIASLWRPTSARSVGLIVSILLLIGLLIFLKTEPLAYLFSAFLRQNSGQATDLASSTDIPWLGFSYLAFRLLAALRDKQNNRLPKYSLREFITYAIFFPAFTAGPIDRAQHFVPQLNKSSSERLSSSELLTGGKRLLVGCFKKFVVADSLALIALNPQNATQVSAPLWTWTLLYAFALRIYFDFSGYTDIALGISRWLGLSLPENFDRPYLRENLTAFWNSWHITLAQWFRAYYFNPLTRWLRTRLPKLQPWLIILPAQLSTMILIGLWHGVTWNFMLWGAWHGLGLFAHNRWLAWAQPRLSGIDQRPWLRRAMRLAGWLVTFQYVTLGWVWFALPNPALAWSVFHKLFGV